MPGGMGDYELTTAVDDPVKPCGIYYIQARKYGDTSIIYNSVEEIKSRLNQTVHFVSNRFQSLGVGMYCLNSENTGNGGCLDYQVRFCCGKPQFIISFQKISPFILHTTCTTLTYLALHSLEALD